MRERKTGVGVLDKAMAILQVFSREESRLTPAEIATRTHLSLPTVYRLAQALCLHGLLEQEERRFRLGMELLRLGSQAAGANDLRRLALPHMHRVQAQTGESIELHGRQQDAHVVLAVVPGRHLLRSSVSPGTAFPLHRGAIGTVLLAWLPPEEQEALVARSAERWRSIPVDLPRLQAEWEEARTQGWSMSEDEPEGGFSLWLPLCSMPIEREWERLPWRHLLATFSPKSASSGRYSFVKPQHTSLRRKGIRGTSRRMILCERSNESVSENTRQGLTRSTDAS